MKVVLTYEPNEITYIEFVLSLLNTNYRTVFGSLNVLNTCT